jgi:ABC-2 type transport system permease protein
MSTGNISGEISESSQAANPIRELWRYRSLLKNLVAREIKVKHKHSVLGIAWTVLSPLITTSIMALVFSSFFGMKQGKGGFGLYVLTGLVAWNLFSTASGMGLASIHQSASIIRKVYVPVAIFPLAAVSTAIVNFGFALLALMIYMVFFRMPVTWRAALGIIPIIELTVFALGVSMLLATLYVYFRDVRWFYDSALLAWFYATPIFYPPEIIGPKFVPYLKLNPLSIMITAFRGCVAEGSLPLGRDIALGALFAVTAFLLGWTVLHRLKQNFINYL